MLCGTGVSGRSVTTIGGTLPDNILLEIFDFYRKDHDYTYRERTQRRDEVWEWPLFVHVCRRWRQVIFESPRRLNLQIFCTTRTPVMKNLGIWPALPIVIGYSDYGKNVKPREEGNVIAALRHPNRVCSVTLEVPGPAVGRVATVMQESFPVLTHLFFYTWDRNAPVLPGGFLGGSAPCLHEIYIEGVPFPALPALLLSTHDLVTLKLYNIPPTGYISPQAMVVGLAALPNLETLIVHFRLATPRPNHIRSGPPVTRTVLPSLTHFRFKGASEYLENLVAHIDSPQLHNIDIEYLNQLVDFQVGQLSKFIGRSLGPKVTWFRHADVTFHDDRVNLTFTRGRQIDWDSGPADVRTSIYCDDIDWQVSHMAQVLSYISAMIPFVIHLNLDSACGHAQSKVVDHVDLQHLLRQFSTVKTLHVYEELTKHVALALEDITEEMVAEVLPSLDLIRLVGQPASSIAKFIAVRQRSGRTVTVIDTESEFDERLKSYTSE